jgi:hypothetical protein
MVDYDEMRIIKKVYHPTITILIHSKVMVMGIHIEGSSIFYQPCTLAYTSFQSYTKGISIILFDAEASLHLRNTPTHQQDTTHLEGMNSKGREAPTLSF